jgi:hypothetical protein
MGDLDPPLDFNQIYFSWSMGCSGDGGNRLGVRRAAEYAKKRHPDQERTASFRAWRSFQFGRI